MNRRRRSQIRKTLQVNAFRQNWRGLIDEYGTPLLVLDPDVVVDQYRLLQSHLRGVRLHYAVKALPHPAALVALAAPWGPVRRRVGAGDRPGPIAGHPDGPLHLHPTDQETRRHRPRVPGGHPHLRRRQPDRSAQV